VSYDTAQHAEIEMQKALGFPACEGWILSTTSLAMAHGNQENEGPFICYASYNPWRVRPYLTAEGKLSHYSASLSMDDVVFRGDSKTIQRAMFLATEKVCEWLRDQALILETAKVVTAGVKRSLKPPKV
jgi:hypothetical protein